MFFLVSHIIPNLYMYWHSKTIIAIEVPLQNIKTSFEKPIADRTVQKEQNLESVWRAGSWDKS